MSETEVGTKTIVVKLTNEREALAYVIAASAHRELHSSARVVLQRRFGIASMQARSDIISALAEGLGAAESDAKETFLALARRHMA